MIDDALILTFHNPDTKLFEVQSITIADCTWPTTPTMPPFVFLAGIHEAIIRQEGHQVTLSRRTIERSGVVNIWRTG